VAGRKTGRSACFFTGGGTRLAVALCERSGALVFFECKVCREFFFFALFFAAKFLGGGFLLGALMKGLYRGAAGRGIELIFLCGADDGFRF
jgi:hypothetical protein